MKKTTRETDARVVEARRWMQRTWLMWGLAPLLVATMLMAAVSAVWAGPVTTDEHTLERGFHAVLAVCAALFLAGFWLDSRWTHSERIAWRIWSAAGGDEFTPSRTQLGAQAETALKTTASSVTALTIIGAAIAFTAVISVWAGLGIGEGFQLILMGVCFQLFVLSRHPYYEELAAAAVRGELAPPQDESDRNPKTK